MRHVVATADGARIGLVDAPGVDPAHLYLPGLGSSAASYFGRVIRHPALRAHRALLLDFLGFGISDRPRNFSYTLEAHAETVARVLDTLGIVGADVIGHSMGGSIALVLAERRPDLVGRLVLPEPNLDPTPRPRVQDYTEEEFVVEGFERALDAVGPLWAATMRLADPVALYRTERSLGRGTDPMMREILLGLQLPRTLLMGEHGEDLDATEALETAGVVIRTVRAAGHTMMIDNPDGFANEVARALHLEEPPILGNLGSATPR
jgi:pimeloyl-ACP methyl ester carboxylesterase